METDCGEEAFAPCRHCNGSGEIVVHEWPCEDCDATGKNHAWGDWKKQQTLTGGTRKYRKCRDCGAEQTQGDLDEVQAKRDELSAVTTW